MWQPAAQTGVVVLKAPPIPKIDHEVPLFPVEHRNKEEEAPPVRKIDHEVPWVEPKHSDKEGLVEDDSADPRGCRLAAPPTSSGQGRKPAEY